MAKLVGLDITMANNTNAILTSLATENHISMAQVQIVLVRKLAERQRCLRKIRNVKDRMRQLARDLMTKELNLGAIDEDVRRLTEAANMGIDDN